jgi:hypothetical protein
VLSTAGRQPDITELQYLWPAFNFQEYQGAASSRCCSAIALSTVLTVVLLLLLLP